MEWKGHYALDHEVMDKTHQELIHLIHGMQVAADQEAATGLRFILEHSKTHFEQENRWMEESGFVPIACHIDEHQRVLESLQRLHEIVESGYSGLGIVIANELSVWFDQHASTMDKALAWHMHYVGYQPKALAELEPKQDSAV